MMVSSQLCRPTKHPQAKISRLDCRSRRPVTTFRPPSARKSRYTAVMRLALVFLFCFMVQPACCLAQVLDAKLHHIRSGQEIEWDEFSAEPEGHDYALKFSATKNETEQ